MPLNRSSVTFCLFVVLAGISGSLAGWFGLSLYLSPNLPSVESLRQYKYETPLKIYSTDEKLIQEYGEKRTIPIRFEEAPPLLIKAFLAAEDDRFYSHNGVSVRGLLRAASQMLLQSETQTGGSTITQQVAKNFFLSFEKTIIRKLKELFLALKIEKELEKDQILELYLNKIPFGHRAYGVRAAAQVYYGKDLAELNLAQLAMIAHMPQRPSDSNPIDGPERAHKRRDWILGRMLRLGYIDEASYQAAVAEPLTAKYHGLALDVYAPYVGEMVRQEMLQRFGTDAYTAGYRVYTTIDSQKQAAAQQAVINALLAYDSRHGYREPELTLDPRFHDPDQEAAADNEEPENLYTLDGAEGEDTAAPQRQLNLDPWMKELRSIPTYGGLAAAAVLKTGEEHLEALLADGSVVEIPWDNAPRRAQGALQLGAVVRVRAEADETWGLYQIPEAQGSLVALDPNNGALLSLVGGFDFSLSNFNRAIQAKRQPGSNFKPFIYTAALLNGFTPASIINDAPIVKYDNTLETVWRPENYGGRYKGPTRLRQGLYQSTNYIAIRLLDSMGVRAAIREMDRFGFDGAELPKDLTLALGSHVLTPLEVATAYTVFANGGYKVEPHFIQRIEDFAGEVIYEARPLTVCRECENLEILEALKTDTVLPAVQPEPEESQLLSLEEQREAEFAALLGEGGMDGELETEEPKPERPPVAPRVLDERTAYLMDNILKDVVKAGSGRRARALGRSDLAGKTGTTNDSVDTWFSGYNQRIVATTWMGFDDNTPLGRSETGSNASLPMWMEFMQTALRGMPEEHPAQPPGIVSVRINSKTGLRTDANDPDAMFEYFRTENVPERGRRNDSFTPLTNGGETDPDDLF
ncbi:penicillin-binding protein 1A [Gilvimarinus sp. F26214L]|uniref:penicillin-binding protein 1A n=1 Tax=Gilvimarinus sp. DZF01 TaxID=3461371 RepID=UPI0040453F31